MFRTLDSAYVAQPASLNTCVDAFVCAFARGAVARSRSGRCPLPSRGEEREREERDFASALLPLLLLLLSFFLFLPLDHAESLHSDDPRIRSSVSFAARAIRFG